MATPSMEPTVPVTSGRFSNGKDNPIGLLDTENELSLGPESMGKKCFGEFLTPPSL